MSKIGKKPIAIPSGVDIKINGTLLVVKGPKGELSKTFPEGTTFVLQDNVLTAAAQDSALWGLSRALAANMVTGVTEGFKKILDFTGVGYKAQVKPARPDDSGHSGGGDSLELNLGFTHPISVSAPKGISFKVEKNSITIEGPDREAVGHVAAKIRSYRPPEPYKGSGIKYRDEVVRRKAGKKAGATAGAA